MATTTVPEVTNVPEVKKAAPVTLTPSAVTKVKEIMGQQNPVPAGLAASVWWVAAALVSHIPCSSRMPPA